MIDKAIYKQILKSSFDAPIDVEFWDGETVHFGEGCLLYTSPSPRDGATSRMPSSA